MEKRALFLDRKIVVFKSLTISKTVYLTMMAPIPRLIIDELKKIQKRF